MTSIGMGFLLVPVLPKAGLCTGGELCQIWSAVGQQSTVDSHTGRLRVGIEHARCHDMPSCSPASRPEHLELRAPAATARVHQPPAANAVSDSLASCDEAEIRWGGAYMPSRCLYAEQEEAHLLGVSYWPSRRWVAAPPAPSSSSGSMSGPCSPLAMAASSCSDTCTASTLPPEGLHPASSCTRAEGMPACGCEYLDTELQETTRLPQLWGCPCMLFMPPGIIGTQQYRRG